MSNKEDNINKKIRELEAQIKFNNKGIEDLNKELVDIFKDKIVAVRDNYGNIYDKNNFFDELENFNPNYLNMLTFDLKEDHGIYSEEQEAIKGKIAKYIKQKRENTKLSRDKEKLQNELKTKNVEIVHEPVKEITKENVQKTVKVEPKEQEIKKVQNTTSDKSTGFMKDARNSDTSRVKDSVGLSNEGQAKTIPGSSNEGQEKIKDIDTYLGNEILLLQLMKAQRNELKDLQEEKSITETIEKLNSLKNEISGKRDVSEINKECKDKFKNIELEIKGHINNDRNLLQHLYEKERYFGKTDNYKRAYEVADIGGKYDKSIDELNIYTTPIENIKEKNNAIESLINLKLDNKNEFKLGYSWNENNSPDKYYVPNKSVEAKNSCHRKISNFMKKIKKPFVQCKGR